MSDGAEGRKSVGKPKKFLGPLEESDSGVGSGSEAVEDGFGVVGEEEVREGDPIGRRALGEGV